MNPVELKIARMRRKVTGKEAAKALGITVDGYFKKEHGNARITLEDAFALTVQFGLTFSEFVNIFFDGDLPFLQDRAESCRYADMAYPLKMARIAAHCTPKDAANALGIPVSAYKSRERGSARITLEQCSALSKLFKLDFDGFNDIFFRSSLPFRNSDFVLTGLS